MSVDDLLHRKKNMITKILLFLWSQKNFIIKGFHIIKALLHRKKSITKTNKIMSNEKYGIETIKKTIALGVSFSTTLGDSLQDGKLDFSEIMNLIGSLKHAPNVIMNMGDLKKEISDLSANERKELNQFMESKYPSNKDKDMIITESIGILLSISRIINAVKK